MKIAVIQTLFPQGHRSLDEGFIKILSIEHELFIVDDGNYFPSDISDNHNIKRIIIPHFKIKRCEVLKRILRRIDLLFVFLSLKMRRCNYDVILFLNIDNDIYKIEKWLPKKKKILMHHNDIDVLTTSNRSVLHSFNKAKDKFYHICLADYIRDAFMSFAKLNKDTVFTVHQPNVFKSDNAEIAKENVVVGIGNSMDESFIKDLIELDTKVTLPCKLLMRSKRISYTGRNIEVFTGFLDRSKYEDYYNISKASLVTYPLNYKYRYSGIIDDSLSKGLIVFCNNTPCGKYFATMYPESVFVIDNIPQLIKLLQLELPSKSEKDMEKFKKRHSDAFVLEQFNKVINS